LEKKKKQRGTQPGRSENEKSDRGSLKSMGERNRKKEGSELTGNFNRLLRELGSVTDLEMKKNMTIRDQHQIGRKEKVVEVKSNQKH